MYDSFGTCKYEVLDTVKGAVDNPAWLRHNVFQLFANLLKSCLCTVVAPSQIVQIEQRNVKTSAEVLRQRCFPGRSVSNNDDPSHSWAQYGQRFSVGWPSY